MPAPDPLARDLVDPPPAAPPDDAALLSRVRRGDHRAFETLFRAHYAPLHAVAARLASPELAEEVVQDVMCSLWERRATLDVRGSARAYLLGAIRFTAASAVRRARVATRHTEATRAVLHPAPAPADAALLDHERARAIEAAIARLPERCRMTFVLVRLEGLSYAEAGAALGVSPKTVDAQMGHALRRLRDDLRAFRR